MAASFSGAAAFSLSAAATRSTDNFSLPFQTSNFFSLNHSPSLRHSPRLRLLCQAAGAASQDVSSSTAGQDRLLKVPISNLRNFCIIAHIDHGKSTLADKLLEMTGTVQKREMKEQFLDNMDLERERGITIKLQAARMRYVYEEKPYCLNLIDTPGHVDFSYEVSRSLAACEGALLVVDASQGVEAQTLANVYLALDNNLEIIPVLNKIDLPGADPDRVSKEIEEIVGLDCSNAIRCSAKEGIGITEILNAIVQRIPPPSDSTKKPLRALIFDSYYDPYRGVVAYFRVIDGTLKKGDRIYFMASGKDYYADEIGVLSPTQMQVNELFAGEVGYLSASIRSVADARVGDTITRYDRKAEVQLPGYQEATPMVFCGLFPVDADQFPDLRDALEKLQLNDAALKVSTRELDLRMNAEEKLKEITNVTNQKLEEIFATFQEKMARAIEEVFAEHRGSPPSRGTSGSETLQSKATMEDLSPPTVHRFPEFQRENEASRIVKPNGESDVGKEDESAIILCETRLEEKDPLQIESNNKVDLQSCGRNGEQSNKERKKLEFKVSVRNLQEKSITIFNRSPPKESDRNDDVTPYNKRQESGDKFGLEFEHLGPPPWCTGAREESVEDRKRDRCPRVASEADLEAGKIVKGDAIIDRRWYRKREEVEREFQKMALRAARECQSEKAVWTVGFTGLEPVFLLVKGLDMLGAEIGSGPTHLGPPPWPGPPFYKFMGLTSNKREIMPGFLQVKYGPQHERMEAANLRSLRLQPPELRSTASRVEPSFEREIFLLPPTAKPPPQPPDLSLEISRLGFIPTASVFHSTSYPIPLNGKVDAAGEDPGDAQFYKIPMSWKFYLAVAPSLEDKADFKVSVRANYVEDESFVLPIPPEPPPDPWINLGSVFSLSSKAVDCTPCQLNGRRVASEDDPGDTLILQFPGLFAPGLTSNDSLDDKAYSKMGDYPNLLPAGENQKNDRVVVFFYQSPRPPEFEANEEIPLDNIKSHDRLIKEACLQVHVGIMFAGLLVMLTNWEGCISLDKWNLQLTVLNAQVNFKRIEGQLTHQSSCTNKNPIKLHFFALAQSTRANSAFN